MLLWAADDFLQAMNSGSGEQVEKAKLRLSIAVDMVKAELA